MNLIDFIFKLVLKFVPMSSEEYAKMKAEGLEWYAGIRTDDEAKNDSKTKLLATAKKHLEKWYFKLAFAIAFIILSKKINDWLISTPEKNEDEE